jgi:hypothetical protein
MFVSSAVVVGGSLSAVHWEKSLADIRLGLRGVVRFAILVVVPVNLMFFVEMTLP